MVPQTASALLQQLAAQPVRRDAGVGVGKCQPARAAFEQQFGAGGARGAHVARVDGDAVEAPARVGLHGVCEHDALRAVAAGVEHDDDAHRFAGERVAGGGHRQRLQAGGQAGLFVMHGNHDADHAKPSFCATERASLDQTPSRKSAFLVAHQAVQARRVLEGVVHAHGRQDALREWRAPVAQGDAAARRQAGHGLLGHQRQFLGRQVVGDLADDDQVEFFDALAGARPVLRQPVARQRDVVGLPRAASSRCRASSNASAEKSARQHAARSGAPVPASARRCRSPVHRRCGSAVAAGRPAAARACAFRTSARARATDRHPVLVQLFEIGAARVAHGGCQASSEIHLARMQQALQRMRAKDGGLAGGLVGLDLAGKAAHGVALALQHIVGQGQAACALAMARARRRARPSARSRPAFPPAARRRPAPPAAHARPQASWSGWPSKRQVVSTVSPGRRISCSMAASAAIRARRGRHRAGAGAATTAPRPACWPPAAILRAARGTAAL